jgi:type II secretory pathway pseudopilin PulG
MKHSRNALTAFSLVEVTLALGVAGFCLIAVFGLLPVGLKTQQAGVEQTKANAIISQITADLRAAIRLPPGLVSKQFGLHGYWGTVGTPDKVYFTNDADQTGNTNQTTVPTDAVLRATISYLSPPVATTSLADIKVTWPAQVDPATGVPTGSVETFIAVNR